MAGLVVEEVVEGEGEEVRVLPAGLLPPPVEVAARHHPLAHAGVVEAEEGLVVVEEVVAPEAVAEGPGLVEVGLVLVDEAVVGLPLAADEGVVEEQVPGLLAGRPGRSPRCGR